jgi:hypothetical protein
MMILLVLVLLGLLFVAGFIVFTLIEEMRDETWGLPASAAHRGHLRAFKAWLRRTWSGPHSPGP